MKKIILIPSYEPDEKLIDLIKTINRDEFDIVVVNDGSNASYNSIFHKIEKDVKLISYDNNMGKGYALKTGIKWISDSYQKDYIIITMDSDGQHKIEDAKKLCHYIEKNPTHLVLGMRKRSDKTPIRSKIGNGITKMIYNLLTGLNVYDTQTGLRAFSDKLVSFLLNIDGNRFEYEMNVLLASAKAKIIIKEIEIETIYIENNKGSHFKTIRDSYLIYKEIIKFSASSIISFFIDYLFYILFTNYFSITLSNVMARIISGTFNFQFNKKYVFQSKNHTLKKVISYILLALFILCFNTFILNIFISTIYLNKYIAKLITEFILFILSYFIQRVIIFKK